MQFRFKIEHMVKEKVMELDRKTGKFKAVEHGDEGWFIMIGTGRDYENWGSVAIGNEWTKKFDANPALTKKTVLTAILEVITSHLGKGAIKEDVVTFNADVEFKTLNDRKDWLEMIANQMPVVEKDAKVKVWMTQTDKVNAILQQQPIEENEDSDDDSIYITNEMYGQLISPSGRKVTGPPTALIDMESQLTGRRPGVTSNSGTTIVNTYDPAPAVQNAVPKPRATQSQQLIFTNPTPLAPKIINDATIAREQVIIRISASISMKERAFQNEMLGYNEPVIIKPDTFAIMACFYFLNNGEKQEIGNNIGQPEHTYNIATLYTIDHRKKMCDIFQKFVLPLNETDSAWTLQRNDSATLLEYSCTANNRLDLINQLKKLCVGKPVIEKGVLMACWKGLMTCSTAEANNLKTQLRVQLAPEPKREKMGIY